MRATAGLGLALLLSGATNAIAFGAEIAPTAVMLRDGIYTDTQNRTLYISDNDKRPGVSACYGNCGHNWPAFEAEDDARDVGDWKVVLRDDGSRQWTYKGKPVYYFVLDLKPGQRNGDGIARAWHVIRP